MDLSRLVNTELGAAEVLFRVRLNVLRHNSRSRQQFSHFSVLTLGPVAISTL
ncbi:hypothetical protein J6590_097809, partial [Homalodisca vitripennis]